MGVISASSCTKPADSGLLKSGWSTGGCCEKQACVLNGDGRSPVAGH